MFIHNYSHWFIIFCYVSVIYTYRPNWTSQSRDNHLRNPETASEWNQLNHTHCAHTGDKPYVINCVCDSQKTTKCVPVIKSWCPLGTAGEHFRIIFAHVLSHDPWWSSSYTIIAKPRRSVTDFEYRSYWAVHKGTSHELVHVQFSVITDWPTTKMITLWWRYGCYNQQIMVNIMTSKSINCVVTAQQ